MVLFAYFFIPQIFFYGMDSLLGAILNTRGRFGANMWTPVINNVVVIIVGGLFIFMAGPGPTRGQSRPTAVQLLGIGTTLGIVIQSIALFPVAAPAPGSACARAGTCGAAKSARSAGWPAGCSATWSPSRPRNLVAQSLANAGLNTAGRHRVLGRYSDLLGRLAVLPAPVRDRRHLGDQRAAAPDERARQRTPVLAGPRRLLDGVRLASVIVVPAPIFLPCWARRSASSCSPTAHTRTAEARYIGEVFGVFSLGLVPFMLTQLQLRVFYSFHENRTAGLIGMVMLIVGMHRTALVAFSCCPARTW